MRITLVLCDRCRAELPAEQKDPFALAVEASYMPQGRRAFRPERHRVELCAACRVAFAEWLGPKTVMPGLVYPGELPVAPAADEPWDGPAQEVEAVPMVPAAPLPGPSLEAAPPVAEPEPAATVIAGPRRKVPARGNGPKAAPGEP